MSITITSGSILDFPGGVGTAIVNPANSFLNHAGGLARIIANAAAPLAAKYPDRPHMWGDADRSWLAAQQGAPLIATGSAHATGAGALPHQAIIHAVGPVWGGGHFMERALLRSAHLEALAVAATLDITRVAFPAISCGVFGFPADQAARIAVEAARTWQHDGGPEVTFYPFGFEAELTRALQEATA